MFALLFPSESRGARVKRETISWEILSYTLVPSSPSLVLSLVGRIVSTQRAKWRGFITSARA